MQAVGRKIIRSGWIPSVDIKYFNNSKIKMRSSKCV
jgi:hypothetical protein